MSEQRKCEKCGYGKAEKEISKGKYLCSICSKFTPSNSEELKKYVEEKIDHKLLETFRKHLNKNIKGMEKKAKSGQIMSRAPFGYKIEKKQLIIDEEKSLIAQKIFMDFLNQNESLNQLASRYGFSVNGLKKILRNFTYIGKVKFSGQISEGKHQPIITSELFNKVQSKLENLGIS